jgi:MoaA/NifB/PqqE/SkfB family radical SAM enzyme
MAEEKKNQASLSREILLKAVKGAAKYSKTVHFSGGGEPTLHPNLLEAIKLTKKLGLKVALSTNGTFLTQEIFDLVDFPRVSLDAGTKEIFEKKTKINLWDKIIGNIKKLKKRKKLGLGFLITPDNYKDIYKFCRLANELRVGWVHIRPAFIKKKNRKIRNLMPRAIETCKKAEKDFPNLEIYFRTDKFEGYWTKRKYDKCRANLLSAVLKANGRFIPCHDRVDLEFGDYYKQSFEEIWGSREHLNTLAKIKIEDCPRCVETKNNEYIQKIFIEDRFKKYIL